MRQTSHADRRQLLQLIAIANSNVRIIAKRSALEIPTGGLKLALLSQARARRKLLLAVLFCAPDDGLKHCDFVVAARVVEGGHFSGRRVVI